MFPVDGGGGGWGEGCMVTKTDCTLDLSLVMESAWTNMDDPGTSMLNATAAERSDLAEERSEGVDSDRAVLGDLDLSLREEVVDRVFSLLEDTGETGTRMAERRFMSTVGISSSTEVCVMDWERKGSGLALLTWGTGRRSGSARPVALLNKYMRGFWDFGFTSAPCLLVETTLDLRELAALVLRELATLVLREAWPL